MPDNAIVASIKSIPPVTRFFTIASVIACLIMSTAGPSSFKYMYINYDRIVDDYYDSVRPVLTDPNAKYYQILYTILEFVAQIYKFGTSMFIPAGIGSPNRFQAILDIYFFYTFSNHLEGYEGKFRGNFADYLWYVIICGTMIHVITLVYDVFFHDLLFPHEMLLACVTYNWSRCFKNATINLMGIVPIKAYYLPLGNLLIKLILGGPQSLIDTLIGIITGYLYLCIQSNTMPIYNLFPGAYGSAPPKQHTSGRRVGMSGSAPSWDQPPTHGGLGSNAPDYIGDSIYDKGYLKAPPAIYKWLAYPSDRSVRVTAFTDFKGKTVRGTREGTTPSQPTSTGVSSGYSWFGGNESGSSGAAFKGKGQRLGG
ncbi:hypothetical protein JA1_005013 [Spathaspora sp. JA1]|nr:hypothetical protein JA1_005013 [Spathaspora sp. JA1]